MNTTAVLTEELEKLFKAEDIGVTQGDIERAAEIVKHCKNNSDTAYNCAVAIINDLTLQPFYLPFEQALIESGIFKKMTTEQQLAAAKKQLAEALDMLKEVQRYRSTFYKQKVAEWQKQNELIFNSKK